MLVSTKGRYALRTMVDLAIHGDGEPVKIKDIANRQGISGKYLEQIISILSRAGFVRSIRGIRGILPGQTVIGLYSGFYFENHRRKPGSGGLLKRR